MSLYDGFVAFLIAAVGAAVVIVPVLAIAAGVQDDRRLRDARHERKIAACQAFEDPKDRLTCLAVLR